MLHAFDRAFDQLQAFREQILDLTQFHTEQQAALLARDLYEVLAKIIRTPPQRGSLRAAREIRSW